MFQDMKMRGFGEHTQKDYIRHVRRFAAFLGQPPDTATVEDLRRFQIDQHERAVGPARRRAAAHAECRERACGYDQFAGRLSDGRPALGQMLDRSVGFLPSDVAFVLQLLGIGQGGANDRQRGRHLFLRSAWRVLREATHAWRAAKPMSAN
jgi:hypothetical protein